MLDTSLIPTNQTAARRSCSRSQLYIDVRTGRMTPPLSPRPGRKVSVWPAYEIDALNRAEIAGASNDEIRALVRELIAQRSAGRPQQAA